MLLYHLLKQFKISFEAAHVNHGWREESLLEAEILRQMCAGEEIVFHEKKLSFSSEEKNLEDQARKARGSFFKTLCQERELTSVWLGHHADDVAETVLKRLFEGASLFHLHGPLQFVKLEGVSTVRPLLGLRKKEILSYLEEKGISYFVDRTNLSNQFLRGRFRTEIFPYLSEQFGKEITPSLCRISKNSVELKEFLEEFLSPYRSAVKREEGEVSLDLSQCPLKTPFEWKALVRDFFEKEGITLTTSTLEAIVAHLRKKSVGKMMLVGSKKIKMDRGNLILFCKNVDLQHVNSCLLK